MALRIISCLAIISLSPAFVILSSTSKLTKERFALTDTSRVAGATTTTRAGELSEKEKHVVIVGAGWGGLSAAHALVKQQQQSSAHETQQRPIKVTLVEASPRVGGLVRDGFTTISGKRPAEAGQHGFWNGYHNIYRLLREEINGVEIDTVLTGYDEQGQYSPRGLEAVWPVYKDQPLQLPTGLAQAAYTKFLKLSLWDRATAVPLVLAFSEFDDSPEAWKKYDEISFRDLCIKLGVSRNCYEQAFEPMILTGLFAPGAECSAAAALGMAYFFVLQSQRAFDVRWCRGNIGSTIFDPWVKQLETSGVTFETSTRVTGFDVIDNKIRKLTCTKNDGSIQEYEPDDVIFAVGAKALNAMVSNSPQLASFGDLRRFANLRGTSVLATRIFLDQNVTVPYSANACWGFDDGIGMTVFDIKALHGVDASTVKGAPGSVIEVDYYHASNLLVMNDDDIVNKVKVDLDIILGCQSASIVDAAIVRLPNAVNWYYPGSYKDMPDVKSPELVNAYFCGDIVRTRHGSWSQEKAFVTGMEAANVVMGKPIDSGILPVSSDEVHVGLGKQIVATFQRLLGGPSLVDFLW